MRRCPSEQLAETIVLEDADEYIPVIAAAGCKEALRPQGTPAIHFVFSDLGYSIRVLVGSRGVGSPVRRSS